MGIEFRRFVRSNIFLINFFIIVLCFLIGYILCKSIDKIENLTIGELLLSEVTVYSQLGFLIFPITIMLPFANDYSQKNIFFYRLLGYNCVKYFWMKVGMIFLSLSIPTLICILAICILYNNFEYFNLTLFYIESVLVWQVLIATAIIFCGRNIIVSYSINLFVWLATIFVTVANSNFYFLAYFDASTDIYKRLSDILTHNSLDSFNYGGGLMVLFIIFSIDVIIVLLSQERWKKSGI